jgi:hypothetical protein
VRSPGQCTAHQRHEARADCQPQARAAVLPRGGGIGLHEGMEQPALRFERNPNSRIAHLKVQLRGLPAGRSRRTRTATSPCWVNLMALPARFISTCRKRTESATI